jgi:membrane-bound serine protease (ClpP class)
MAFGWLLALALAGLVQAKEAAPRSGEVAVFPVHGMVSEAQFFFLRRALKNAEAAGASGIILDMDTPGGDLKATEKIVQMFSKTPVPVFTYINPNAGSAGALIALGTKKVFMAPVSAIGAAAPVAGSGQEIPETMNAKIVSYYSGYFRSVAQKNGYHPELVDGFMNVDKEVKIGEEVLNPKGALLTLSAQEAVRMVGGKPLLASGIAPGVEEVARECGLDPAGIVRVEPSGFEAVAQWITVLAPLFLIGGVLGAYLEFKAPGFGVAGVLSLVCFTLFFGGHYIAGLTGLEMIALFALGLFCVVLELVFFPGVVVLALGGTLMVLAALFFSMADFYPSQPVAFSLDFLMLPMVNLGLALVFSLAGAALLARFLPKVPLFRGLLLSSQLPVGSSSPSAVSDLGDESGVRPGDEGRTLTPLRPSGKIQIGDTHIDAIAQGEFIESGTPVRVLSIQSGQVVVGRVS